MRLSTKVAKIRKEVHVAKPRNLVKQHPHQNIKQDPFLWLDHHICREYASSFVNSLEILFRDRESGD